MQLDNPKIRLAELVATLSLGTDLGLGQPMEHVIRQTLIALRMAELIGLERHEREVVYYAGLLAWVGCHTDAYEQAKWFGDDISMKADGLDAEEPGPRFFLSHLGSGRSFHHRARLGIEILGAIRRGDVIDLGSHWLAADELARRLGLGEDVRDSLKQSFERWDGKGLSGTQGDEIAITARVISLADVIAVFHRKAGIDAAISMASRRSGTQFDPQLVEVFRNNAVNLLSDLDGSSNWDRIISSEPNLGRYVPPEALDDVLNAIGDFTDLKSPFTIGHSRAVASLAAAAARISSLTREQVIVVRRAGTLHDIGRLGVSNAIWDKRGPLTGAEMERVRMHPYLTQRMLAFSPSLAPLGAIAVQHHERLDGSGYPHGLSGRAISQEGRILAAADVYHAMVELRPHRSAWSPEQAAARLRAEVASNRLDASAVDAVLRVAGHTVPQRRDSPAGLTLREIDVLRLMARGMSHKQIAQRLTIAPKTARNHIEHIYSKIGVSNRARASLFAVHHGLLTDTYNVVDGPEPVDI
ncbi:MAG: HD domain-containing phosphohydrolase [Nitrolancea sp.]